MRRLPTLLLAPALALGTLVGCERGSHTDARTEAKLRAAAERAGPPTRGPGYAPEDARLAQLAAGESVPSRSRPVPSPAPSMRVGTVRVSLRAVSQGATVRGRKVTLTSPDAFVRVELELHNEGASDATVDLSSASLKDPSGKTFAIAKDAQHAAGSRALMLPLLPGGDGEAVLYFEVERTSLPQPLVLTVSGGGAASASLTLP